MSLVLSVDGDRWRAHLQAFATEHPALVPVVKGNGYGFGKGRLARRAAWLGADTIAVGTYDELGEVANRFDGSLLVLTPWRPFGVALDLAPGSPLTRRVVHTVSRVEDLDALLAHDPSARFVLERRTSMLRHGLTARELREAGTVLAARGGLASQLAGVAMHLPMTQGSNVSEVRRLMTDVVAADLADATVWVSHLTDSELWQLAAAYPDFTFRPRVGTSLWLGDRSALSVRATVLDVHPVERGDVFGYRGRSVPKSGTILVVSGGTAHGIGLEAPSGDLSIRSRAATIARGGMDAVGFVRSPFSIGGKQRLFAEPPHMQASMLFLPSESSVPAVGDTVDVRVRYTATTFDRVEIS